MVRSVDEIEKLPSLCFSGIWAISQSNLIMLAELSNLTQCWACLNPLILIEFKHV